MLTHKTGDAGDVASVPLENGWLVTWVDERDGDPEVYASRVDAKLARIGREQRLSKAPGPATGVTLVAAGESALVAWADARDPQQPGEADIYLTRITGRDATPSGNERLVMATRGHSFSPKLEPLGDGFVLGWLERGREDAPGSAAVMFERLDANGAARGEPRRFAVEHGEPSAFALDCEADGCHALVSIRADDAAIYGAVLAPDLGTFTPRRLVSLGSKAAVGVPLALEGNELVYADADADGAWKLRGALIDWR
jgi:hypothetical protein